MVSEVFSGLGVVVSDGVWADAGVDVGDGTVVIAPQPEERAMVINTKVFSVDCVLCLFMICLRHRDIQSFKVIPVQTSDPCASSSAGFGAGDVSAG